jgi:hypothetical protein
VTLAEGLTKKVGITLKALCSVIGHYLQIMLGYKSMTSKTTMESIVCAHRESLFSRYQHP